MSKQGLNLDTMAPKLRVGLMLVLLMFFGGCNSVAQSNSEFKVKILAEPLANGLLVLDVELLNNSDEEIVFLPWGTALESNISGPAYDVFELSSSGKKGLNYLGPMIKRLPPQDSDYISLKPGESVTNSQDISKAYKFCSNKVYSITPKPILRDQQAALIEDIQVETVTFTASAAFQKC